MILLQIPDDVFYKIRFNQYTYPGWFCAIIWIIYGIFLVIHFIDNLDIKEKIEKEKENEKEKEKEYENDIVKGIDKIDEKESSNYFENNNKTIEDVKNSSFTSNLIEYDIRNLIREQETTFSYMSISFVILVAILFIIRVINLFKIKK